MNFGGERTLSNRCCQLPWVCAMGEDAPRAPRVDGLLKPFARGVPLPPRAAPNVFPRFACPNVAVAFEWPPRGPALLKPRPRVLLEAPRAVVLLFEPLPRPRPRPAVPNEGSMVVASAFSDASRHVLDFEDRFVDAWCGQSRGAVTRLNSRLAATSSPKKVRSRKRPGHRHAN